MVNLSIHSNLRREKLQKQIKAIIFLEAVLAIEIIQQPQSGLEEKDSLSILKDDFAQEPTHPFSYQ